MIDNKVIEFKVSFPYRGDELKQVLSHKKEKGVSVGYWLDLRVDSNNNRPYFIMKATFTVKNEYLNGYTMDGVIGIDLNWDNISWVELDKNGCRIDGGMIRFSLEGKSSGQISDILGRACHQIILIAKKKQKPIVKEKIDLNDKRQQMTYKSRKGNRHSSMFAYSKMDVFIKGKALRNDIYVYEVDPAYTSMVGKVKYMRFANCPVHLVAAYVIGRRGMGYKDKLPKYVRSSMSTKQINLSRMRQYRSIYKKVSMVKPWKYYKKIDNLKQIAS